MKNSKQPNSKKPKPIRKRRMSRRKLLEPYPNQVTVYEYLENIRYEVDEDDVFSFMKKFEKKLNYPLDHTMYFKKVYNLYEQYGKNKINKYINNLDKLDLDPRSYINKFVAFRRKLESNVLGGF